MQCVHLFAHMSEWEEVSKTI